MSSAPKISGKTTSGQETARMTIAQAVTDALRVEMERDPNVVVMGEDVGKDGGVFRATDGLIDQFGPERVIDTPLSENGIVGSAIGMAIGGLRPVAEIQFMGFVYLALNQLFAHAARYRWRTRSSHSIPIVVRMPYGGGIHAPELHSESYEALFAHTPGLKVVIPSNPYDTKGLLISAIRDDDPVIFLEPKKIYRAFREEVPTGDYSIPLGKAKLVREGNDITLIAYGAMMRPTLEAAEKLQQQGVSAEVIDLRTVHPFDRDAILQSVKKTGRCVVIHEAPRICGIGAEISALIHEELLLHLLAPVQRVTGYDTPFPYARTEKYYLPNAEKILDAANRALNY